MSTTPSPSLKSGNRKWLAALVVADVALILAVMFSGRPDLSTAPEYLVRLILGTAAPLAVFLLVNVLPHNIKAMLVFWRPLGVLPGCEAFTRHGPNDPRIDMAALQRNIGVLPNTAAEQNSRWYQLFKQVENDTTVFEAHRLYLLYRDMAVLSVLLLLAVPAVLWVLHRSSAPTAWTAGVFAVQYLVTALSARWSGVRMVCNVLAVHAARPTKKKR